VPTCTHSVSVAPLYGLLPLRFDLVCRCSTFIVNCLNSSNTIVTFVAGQGVLHRRMHSPVGGNAQHSATLLETTLSKPASINKKMAWTTVNNRVLSDSDFSHTNVIRALFYIKHNFAYTKLYSKYEIDLLLEYCCTS